MATATERIPVLVSAAEKSQIAGMAKAAGLSMGEYLRRAASAFRPSDEDQIFAGMIAQMHKTAEQASDAIERSLQAVAASNRRIAAMERKERR